MVDEPTRDLIQRFLSAVAAQGIHVEKAVIFGSHANGTARPDSDVDVAVLSPDFGRDRFEEGRRLLRAAWRIDPRIEPVPIASASYDSDSWVPLIHEIRKTGIVILPAA